MTKLSDKVQDKDQATARQPHRATLDDWTVQHCRPNPVTIQASCFREPGSGMTIQNDFWSELGQAPGALVLSPAGAASREPHEALAFDFLDSCTGSRAQLHH